MAKKMTKNLIAFILVLLTAYAFGGTTFLQNTAVQKEKIKMYPKPGDPGVPGYRNYFFLQSFEDNTRIIIGDFTGAENVISMIVDDNSDNTIDKIIDYYPDSGKFSYPNESASQYFTSNIEELKKDIISGKCFEVYSYQMKSLNDLLDIIDKGRDIVKQIDGYRATKYDPDKPSSPMSVFFFQKKLEKYDLKFQTIYYVIHQTQIRPPLQFSVFCEKSKDPVVAQTVEDLISKAKTKVE